MKEIRKIDLALNGYEELFMSSEERADAKKPKVEEVAISELFPFKDHPFKVKQDEELKNLMESIWISAYWCRHLQDRRRAAAMSLSRGTAG